MFRGGVGERLRDAAAAFAGTARSSALRRAQGAFGLLWASEWAFMVALAVVAYADAGTSAVGLVTAARMVPAALLAPFGAALADRMARERLLVLAAVARAATIGAAAALLAAGAPPAWTYAAAVLATAAFVVVRPAHSALLPSLCSTPQELTAATVVRGLMDSAGTLAGPAAVTALLALTSPQAALAAVAAACGWAAVLLGRLDAHHPVATTPAQRHLLREVREGAGVLARHPPAAIILGLAVAQTFTRGCLAVLTVVLALDVLDLGDAGVGALSTALGAGAVAGSFAAGLLTGTRALARFEGVGVALWGLPLLACAAWPEPAAVAAFLAVVGVGNALVDVGLFTLPARMLPDEVLGRVFGTFESLVALMVAAGSLVAPLAVHALGPRGALVAVGAVTPLLVALAWPVLVRIDAEVGGRDGEIALLQRVPMLRLLPLPAIERLARAAQVRRVAGGTTVCREGDAGDAFYVLADGVAQVRRDGHAVARLTAGDGFGEIALLRDVPRVATVIALEDLELLVLHRTEFLPAVSGHRPAAAEADAAVRRLLAG